MVSLSQHTNTGPEDVVVKSPRERLDIIAAYRDLGSFRAAAALCGTTDKTVKHVVLRQQQGPPPPRAQRRHNTADVDDGGGVVPALRPWWRRALLLTEHDVLDRLVRGAAERGRGAEAAEVTVRGNDVQAFSGRLHNDVLRSGVGVL